MPLDSRPEDFKNSSESVSKGDRGKPKAGGTRFDRRFDNLQRAAGPWQTRHPRSPRSAAPAGCLPVTGGPQHPVGCLTPIQSRKREVRDVLTQSEAPCLRLSPRRQMCLVWGSGHTGRKAFHTFSGHPLWPARWGRQLLIVTVSQSGVVLISCIDFYVIHSLTGSPKQESIL